MRRIMEVIMESIIPVLMGACIIILGLGLLAMSVTQKKECTETAVGVVVDMEIRLPSAEDHTTAYFPVIEFEDYQVTHRVGTHQPKYQVGQNITIKYQPRHPENYYIVGEEKMSGCAGLSIGIL